MKLSKVIEKLIAWQNVQDEDVDVIIKEKAGNGSFEHKEINDIYGGRCYINDEDVIVLLVDKMIL